jgi:hypothetical protein
VSVLTLLTECSDDEAITAQPRADQRLRSDARRRDRSSRTVVVNDKGRLTTSVRSRSEQTDLVSAMSMVWTRPGGRGV